MWPKVRSSKRGEGHCGIARVIDMETPKKKKYIKYLYNYRNITKISQFVV